jgi:mannose-6-phosphate isomerase-like protein (cupin superfamily)
MKKLSAVLTGVVFSAFYFGIEYPAFAHGTHLIPDSSPLSDPNQPPRSLPYRFVTPTGSEIITDFLRNPNIRNHPRIEELRGLNLTVPRLRDEISNEETISTFQVSQGLYQEVVRLKETGMACDLFEFLLAPEATTEFHAHLAGWELFYVVGGDPANDCREDNDNDCLPDNDTVIVKFKADADGTFNVADPANPFSVIEDEEIDIQREVPKGSFVAVPAGKIHTWFNAGDKPVRILVLITPGGIAEGFRAVGAPAGIFKKLPALHPLTIPPFTDNENGNCSPTGNKKEVSCEVPENPEFYDFDRQAEQPGILELFKHITAPTTITDENGEIVGRCPVAYDSTGFRINPADDTPGDLCPSCVSETNDPACMVETNDPFSGSTFLNPFVLLTFGQTAGILTPALLNAKLFAIGEGEGYFAKKSPEHELFRVLEGKVGFFLGKEFRLAEAGTSVFIPEGKHFGLIGTASGAKVIQFSVSVPEVPEEKEKN